jgi:hypothetical protein
MMNCLKPNICSLLCVSYDENGHHLELTDGVLLKIWDCMSLSEDR